MINIQDGSYTPTLEEICAYVRNPALDEFCAELCKRYKTDAKIEFSKCSWAYGWNIKFRKSGKGLCTIYPKENYFTVLVVVGAKEKEQIEALLPECSAEIREIYRQTEEGNGQRWLMIDMEDHGSLYEEVMRFIEVRSGKKSGAKSET